MTRNDILNNVDAEKKVELIFNKWQLLCRQSLADSIEQREETWKDLCRVHYRDEDGCVKCKAAFLMMEVEDED